MNFADTNWLASAYIEPHAEDTEAAKRRRVVERFMRQHGGQLAISHVVLLEARNVFSRITGEEQPREWQTLEADFGGRLYVDPMNWDLLRRECNALFLKYSYKANLGTFDTAIVASVKLAGGQGSCRSTQRHAPWPARKASASFPRLSQRSAGFWRS